MQENANSQQNEPFVMTPLYVSAVPAIAPAGTRFGAAVLDGLVQLLGCGLVALALWVSRLELFIGPILIVLPLLYSALQLQIWGRTVGMRALGIQVVPITPGARLTAGQAWLRSAVALLPQLLPSPFGLVWSLLDPAWLLWDRPNRQTLHDKAARTVVVTTR